MTSFRAALRPTAAALLALAAALPAAAGAEGPAEQLTFVDPTAAQEDRPPCTTLCESYPEAYGAVPADLLAADELLFFVAGEEETEGEPWVSDGTPGGTRRLADLCPGHCTSHPQTIAALDGPAGPRFFFWATTPDFGREPWVSDGTPEGTRLLADLCPGTCSSDHDEPQPWWGFEGELEPAGKVGAALPGRVVFVAEEPAPGSAWLRPALYASDGTAEGTVRVMAVEPDRSLDVLAAAGDGRRVFLADRQGFGSSAADRLWVTDGTPEGVHRLEVDCGHLFGGEPFQDGVVFIASCGSGAQRDLWVHLGPASAAPVRLGGVPGASRLTPLDDRFFFFRSEGDREVLWRSDGTVAGTGRAVVELPWDPHFIAAAGGRLYLFHWFDEDDGYSVAVTDGVRPAQVVATGRRMVELPITAGQHALWWESVDEGFDFHVQRLVSHSPLDGVREVQLFRTPAIPPGGGPRQANVPPRLAVGGDRLFVSGNAGGGVQLWGLDFADAAPRCLDRPEAQCLAGGRFAVDVAFRNQHAGGAPGTGVPEAATRAAADQSGYFWFFHPDNLELAVKVVDGRRLDGHWWVFAGGTTDLEYELTVTDRVWGESRTYRHAPGDFCGVVDTRAFEGAAAAGAVAAGSARRPAGALSTTAGLGPGGRFEVAVTYANHHAGGAEIAGHVEAETADTAAVRFFPGGGVETMVKVLDGRTVNGRWWVLWGGLTDLGYEIEVHDRQTGLRRTFTQPPGNACGGADTVAFADAAAP